MDGKLYVLLSVENSRRHSAVETLGRGERRGQSSRHFSSAVPRLKPFYRNDDMVEEGLATSTTAVEKQSELMCVASTGDKYRCTVDEAHPGWAEQVYGVATSLDRNESNCFRHALLSADGTAVVTYNEDLILRTFAV